MSNTWRTIGLDLDPVEGLFFRDGRPFGEASRARSVLPSPQTIAGAVRTYLFDQLGFDFARLQSDIQKLATLEEAVAVQGDQFASVLSARIAGPWFTLQGEPLLRVPANLFLTRGEEGLPFRLDPLRLRLPGWEALADGMVPLWHRSRLDGERAKGYLTMAGMKTFLAGGLPKGDTFVAPEDLYGFDQRVGVRISPLSMTTEEGFLYAVSLLVLKPGVGMYAEVSADETLLKFFHGGTFALALGGEGKRVVASSRKPFSWPSVETGSGAGNLILLTTPAWFGGWRPGGLELTAAAIAGSVPVSGWDLARGGPRPTRFMVDAGSVYFLKSGTLPSRELCVAEDARNGYGNFLVGRWNHA